MDQFSDRGVSIVTPAYNAARFIGETIASVQAQTYPHWELLIVDDVSQDATCDIVERAARKEERIRLIRRDVNGGPGESRNSALEAARGRYVAFLDSDDLWLPEKLEKQVDFLRKGNFTFCYTQYRRINEKGEAVGRLVPIPAQLAYRQLLKNTAIATSTVMLDREHTGTIHMMDTYYDDLVLWLALLKRGLIATGLREDLMRYRVVHGSVSRSKLHSAMWVWHTFRKIEGLSIPASTWYFAHYAINGLRKYRRF